MTEDAFWTTIDRCIAAAGGCQDVADRLIIELINQPCEELIAFEEWMCTQLERANRYDLWAVAYLLQGGCSDDGFLDFRGWLISQGRHRFEAALQDPTRAADELRNRMRLECEAILYVGLEAYRRKTGHEMPEDIARQLNIAGEPAGLPWEPDDLMTLFPDLWARFAPVS